MSTGKLVVLVAVSVLTSVISVVTGSTSLITVPVMIALDIETARSLKRKEFTGTAKCEK